MHNNIMSTMQGSEYDTEEGESTDVLKGEDSPILRENNKEEASADATESQKGKVNHEAELSGNVYYKPKDKKRTTYHVTQVLKSVSQRKQAR